jgi:hypothetical protein
MLMLNNPVDTSLTATTSSTCLHADGTLHMAANAGPTKVSGESCPKFCCFTRRTPNPGSGTVQPLASRMWIVLYGDIPTTLWLCMFSRIVISTAEGRRHKADFGSFSLSFIRGRRFFAGGYSFSMVQRCIRRKRTSPRSIQPPPVFCFVAPQVGARVR